MNATDAYVLVGGVLFAIGLVGFLSRRNLIVMFLATEVMFQGVILNLVGFGLQHMNLAGQAFALFLVVVAAVIELARDRGPEAITTQAIADRLGVTHGALFRHFPDKSAMWAAVFDWVQASLGQVVDAAFAATTLGLLTDIASKPNWYYYAPDTSDLSGIYDQISYQIPCVVGWP